MCNGLAARLARLAGCGTTYPDHNGIPGSFQIMTLSDSRQPGSVACPFGSAATPTTKG